MCDFANLSLLLDKKSSICEFLSFFSENLVSQNKTELVFILRQIAVFYLQDWNM